MFVVVLAVQIHFTAVVVDRFSILLTVLTVAVLTLIFEMLPEKWTSWVNPVISAAANIAVVTAIVYFSDGINSPFYPLYYLVVLTTAAVFGLSGAMITAAIIAIISFGVDAIAAGTKFTDIAAIDDIVKTLPYLFLFAAIAGALRERIRALAESTELLRSEQRQIEAEMQLAHSVQMAQLPTETPELSGVDVFVWYRPAREVGGDLYDFYPVSQEYIGILVADVSGKGVPAALLVSSAKYSARQYYSPNIAEMISHVNHHLLSVTTEEAFVTLLYGMLDIKSRMFRYINAGHMPPLVLRHNDGTAEVVSYSDPPLGVMDDVEYSQRNLQLEPGDILVLYTDGITDALCPGPDGIGELQELLSEMKDSALCEWANILSDRLNKPAYLDDTTLIAVKVKQV